MKHSMQPLPARLAALELLVNETGLADELNARKRAEIDARRAELAAELKAFPNRERESAALAKEVTRTTAAFVAAQTAYVESERAMKEATTRAVIAQTVHEGARQRILTELERAAPHELADALDELSLADDLLRRAVRTDVIGSRNWLGKRVHNVTSNVDAIASARDAIAGGMRTIRELAQDGVMSSDAMVLRCIEILDATLEPAFAFIPREKWARRRSRPASDLVIEVTGYAQ
jgi:hypothetical protein